MDFLLLWLCVYGGIGVVGCGIAAWEWLHSTPPHLERVQK